MYDTRNKYNKTFGGLDLIKYPFESHLWSSYLRCFYKYFFFTPKVAFQKYSLLYGVLRFTDKVWDLWVCFITCYFYVSRFYFYTYDLRLISWLKLDYIKVGSSLRRCTYTASTRLKNLPSPGAGFCGRDLFRGEPRG